MFLILFPLNISFFEAGVSAHHQKIIYVDSSNEEGPWDGTIQHPFQYIQDGINNANDNDMVLINPGIYDESLRISRSIHLIGLEKNTTIISSSNASEFLVLDAVNSTIISNLTFSCRNHERLDIIRMINCHHCTFSNIVIESSIFVR